MPSLSGARVRLERAKTLSFGPSCREGRGVPASPLARRLARSQSAQGHPAGGASLRLVATLLLLALTACSSKAYAPTVFITNATCSSGPCRTLQVLAYDETVQAAPVPGGWGFELGYVSSASGCLTFPHSTPAMSNGVTLANMTVADGFQLSDRDVETLVETRNTSTFVPQDAPGWSVTLDTFPVNPTTPVAMSKACTP